MAGFPRVPAVVADATAPTLADRRAPEAGASHPGGDPGVNQRATERIAGV